MFRTYFEFGIWVLFGIWFAMLRGEFEFGICLGTPPPLRMADSDLFLIRAAKPSND
jgi:hypothetical protein